ncbi:hypothetical protein QUF74_18395 [Candidatus Halobeggiatoa sp. HSG11]|nr:hypothetical protein [Candidatus Halobeggiatoa sp. HSG11]
MGKPLRISLVEQVGGYQEYEFDRTVYTIVVLTSTPRDGSVNFSCAVSDMNPIDEFGDTVAVYPHRLVFLCPRQVNDKTPARRVYKRSVIHHTSLNQTQTVDDVLIYPSLFMILNFS